MSHKPRFYSTVPNATFLAAAKQLTPSQLRLFLFLEFKAGSDASGIDSDEPNLEGCRYVRMRLSTITKRLGISENHSTRRMLARLKTLGYIAAFSNEWILLPKQGNVRNYFQNFECVLDLPHWKLFNLLLVHKRQEGEDLVVEAGHGFFCVAACGHGRTRTERLRWISQGLAEFQRLGFLELIQPTTKVSAAVYRVHRDRVLTYAANRQARPTKLRRRTTTSTPPDSAVALPPISAVALLKENPPLKNPIEKKTRTAHQVSDQGLENLDFDPGIAEDKQEQDAAQIVATINPHLPASTEPEIGLSRELARRLPQLRSCYQHFAPQPADLAAHLLAAIRQAYGDQLVPLGVLLFQKSDHWQRVRKAFEEIVSASGVYDCDLAASLVGRKKPTADLLRSFETADLDQELQRLTGGYPVSPGRIEHIRRRVLAKLRWEIAQQQRLAHLLQETSQS